MRRTSLPLLVAIALAAPVLAQGTLKNGWHEDTRNGFKLKILDKWECVPIGVDEKWIVATYLSDKAVALKKSEFRIEQKPQLRVIVFSDEARKAKPVEARADASPEEKARAAMAGMQVPYKDYKDYVKRNGQDGGYFFSSEKDTKLGEVPVSQYEIKFEKLTQAPRHVVTWVFRGDAADYAIEYEVLEDHWEKYSPQFLSSLQSFKFIKRESSVVGTGGSSTGSARADVGDSTSPTKRSAWKALSAKERADRRKSTEEVRFQRVKSSLPPGWTVKTTPLFLVVSHTDAKYTDKVVEAASACRSWLDKNLGGISDEYVMRSVIRICADYDEYKLFHKGSADSYSSDNREIVAFKDANMGRRSGFDMVFRDMFFQYVSDKDALLGFYAPPWIMVGLSEAIAAAVPEGGTLKLSPDTMEAEMLRDAQKSGTKMGARQLMEAPAESLYTAPAAGVFAARLARHFLATKKDFVVTYLKASSEAANEMITSNRGEYKEAKTEEEEEARAKEMRESGKKRSAEMIQKVHEKACKWSDKEWQSLEAAFAAALK